MKINIVLMLTGLLVTYSVYANDSVRTGLWEVTTRSDLLGLVQHVPPENMQQLQNLAKQYGLKIPKIENGAAISHVCITPEMAQQEIQLIFTKTALDVPYTMRLASAIATKWTCIARMRNFKATERRKVRLQHRKALLVAANSIAS